MTEPRFLVVRLGSLGDIVHTFPAVAGLRDSFPACEIVWLTHPRWSSLIACSGLASEVWTVDSRDLKDVRAAIARIRRSPWDSAIDYQGLWKSASLAFLAGVQTRIGFSSKTIREFGVPILYTDRVKCRAAHIADQNGELTLATGASKPLGNFTLQIPTDAVSRVQSLLHRENIEHFVALTPGGGWRSKCWPADRFGALCQLLNNALGMRCVINYGPGEESLAAEVLAASGNSNPLLYDGELGELMALLKHAKCIVGGDTGPLHLAVALGTPPVALFGPTDPARNGPYPPQDVTLRSPRARTTYTRYNEVDLSLLDISIESVFDAVKQQLRVNP